jgi:putative tricarboxylic transport membrane protein
VAQQTFLNTLGPRLPAAALAAFGLAALYKASALPFGSASQPGSGFFPTLIGVALVVFGAVSCFAAPAKREAAEAPARGEAAVWLVSIALLAYALALPRVGFVPCTAAIILLLLRGIGGVSWLASLIAAIAAAVACYLLFTRLGVALPPGVLALK